MKQLVIIGASGHGKVVADIAKKIGYDEICFLDDDASLTECGGYAVIGKSGRFIDFNCDIFVAIGDPNIRKYFQTQFELHGKTVPTLIHPNASIAENVQIGNGTLVVAGAVINPGVRIGKGCIINTCSSVDHDCVVGDYVHIAVGSHLCGTVTVGNGTWIGAGATVSNNVSICSDCMIGAGGVVVNDIQESGTYVGVPARRIDMEKKSVKNAEGGVSRRIVYHKISVQLSISGRAA